MRDRRRGSGTCIFAIDQRIGEAGDMAGGLPDFGMHEDRGVETFDVLAGSIIARHHRSFTLRLSSIPSGPVVPDGVDPAVDFGGWKTKPRRLQSDTSLSMRVVSAISSGG